MKKIALSLLALSAAAVSVNSNATVIGFESDGSSFFTYNQVDFYDGTDPYVYDSGYLNVANETSTDYVAFNPFAKSPSTFTWSASDSFNLNGFTIAGAWGTQTLTIDGYNGSNLIYSSAFDVSLNPLDFIANWENLTSFQITTGSNYAKDSSVSGNGQHWALNDLVINESFTYYDQPTATPDVDDQTPEVDVFEPATSGLFAVAFAGFAASRKRR